MDYENEEWLKEREQKLKEEKRQQNMQIVRLILGGYLIYLGFSLIHGTITGDGARNAMFYLYCVIGVVFILAGIFALLYSWRIFKQKQEREYEAHLAALEAEKEKSESGDTASDKDDGWGYRPEPPEED